MDQALTYGDYFTAVQDYLSSDNLSAVRLAAAKFVGESVALEDIDHISIYLIKYGAFYHPSYGVATVNGLPMPFVINVAVSQSGREVIDREFQCLELLTTQLDPAYWPRVVCSGHGEDLHGRQVPIFLGQWFEGFYEFHLSGNSPEGHMVTVWDTEHGHRLLDPDQVQACMQQAACILAYAYNPLTFEAIRQWHHAAGDFVMAVDGTNIDLRLITVRQYAPVIDQPEPDVASMLEALLLVIVETSLKLRMDRLDGVGQMACYHEEVVPPICRGFFQGLKMGAPIRGLPEDFDVTVKEYAALHDVDQLKSMAMAYVAKATFSPGERDLIESILDGHIAALAKAFRA